MIWKRLSIFAIIAFILQLSIAFIVLHDLGRVNIIVSSQVLLWFAFGTFATYKWIKELK